MNTTTKRIWLRRLLLLLGTALFGGGVVAGYFWFYRLAPIRHLADPAWRKTHSVAAIWAEEQTKYRRANASPDIFWCGDKIGYFGDKEWTLWLVDNLRNEEAFRFCGCTQAVLKLLTNQDIKEDKDAWIAWVEKHEGESQEQWIQQGFAQRGIAVHLPPTKEDWKPLLLLLGNDDKDANDETRISGSLKYNAFRWLRDSGFNPHDYIAANAKWRSTEQSALGICNYVGYAKTFPRSDRLGLLAFSNAEPPFEPDLAEINTPKAKAIAYAATFGGLGLGVALLAISIRMRRSPRVAANRGITKNHEESDEHLRL
jgi:hypothetical protein